MLDRRSSFRREIEKTGSAHIPPMADTINDQNIDHDKPTLKDASLVEVQVVWQINGLELRRIVQPTEMR
jgi:hypothetical protein